MSAAGRSIHVFSYWVLACGVGLFVAPNTLIMFLGVESGDGITLIARLFGMVLVFLGIYYFLAGRCEAMRPFYRWTVFTRCSAFVIGVLLVALKAAPPILILFVAVDLIGAIWTASALHRCVRDAETVKTR